VLTTTARRAEDLITSKIRRDAAAPAPRQALDAEVGHWGRIVALRVPALPQLSPYNKARGVNEDDLPHVEEVSAFFTGAGIVPTLEVWAGDASDRLCAALAHRGFYAGITTATMHLEMDGRRPVRPTGGSVSIEELDPDDAGAEYFAVLTGGYELSQARPEHLAMLRAEHDPATVRRYLARVDGQPAAAASLYLHPHGALLSGAATLPQYRRHGCQSALITHRVTVASALTDLAAVTVAIGSASQTNLERAGFRQTHTRTAWRPLRHCASSADTSAARKVGSRSSNGVGVADSS
jgi:ribosomal protein S18 acetylase RimI-like enzyme